MFQSLHIKTFSANNEYETMENNFWSGAERIESHLRLIISVGKGEIQCFGI